MSDLSSDVCSSDLVHLSKIPYPMGIGDWPEGRPGMVNEALTLAGAVIFMHPPLRRAPPDAKEEGPVLCGPGLWRPAAFRAAAFRAGLRRSAARPPPSHCMGLQAIICVSPSRK